MSLGGYVVFVDADDYLDKDALYRLNNIITSHKTLDFILCNNIYHHRQIDKQPKITSQFVPKKLENRIFSPKDILLSIPKLHLYSVYSSIFSCDFLARWNLYFEAFIIFEDILFMQIAFTLAKHFYITSEAIYHYRTCREDSIMNTKSRQKTLKATFSYFKLASIFLSHSLNAQDDVFKTYFRHWAIFYAKETLRKVQFLSYIDDIGFTKQDLKPFVQLLPLKYRFCYRFPLVYGFPKRVRLLLEQFIRKL